MEKSDKSDNSREMGKNGKSRRIQKEITEITENDSILSLVPGWCCYFCCGRSSIRTSGEAGAVSVGL
jgi:hypothetical protein